MKKTILFLAVILTFVLLVIPVAAQDYCTVHSLDYHFYDSRLIDYVGTDAFYAWHNAAVSVPGENGCPWGDNLYRFIHYFQIPQDVFEDMIYTAGFWNDDISVEILYGVDEQTADAYYRDYKSREDYNDKKVSFMEIRFNLLDLAEDTEAYRAFYDKYLPESLILPFSVADFVRITGIAKEDLQALFESWRVVEYPHTTKVRNFFSYDFDLLYELAEEPEKTTPLDKINEDLLFCGQPVIEKTVYTSPQTGDTTKTAAVVCILSAVFLLVTLPVIRKRRK